MRALTSATGKRTDHRRILPLSAEYAVALPGSARRIQSRPRKYAGVKDGLDSLSFGERALDFLAERGFADEFLACLDSLGFTGEVRAPPEGTLVSPNEPLLEVTAPTLEAQLFETVVINQIGFQPLVAATAARMRDVIERYRDGQSVIDFGSRRAHGIGAGMKALRAAFVGGFGGTSNVAAGEAFGVPVSGTMAQSWVQSYGGERAAFEAAIPSTPTGSLSRSRIPDEDNERRPTSRR